MEETRIIKRYQNRKLYDTQQSCYVTLEEIGHILREGREIKVIDNQKGDEITYPTQVQLLFERERKMAIQEDVELLKRVIRSEEGTFTGYIRRLERAIEQGADVSLAGKTHSVAQAEETPSVLN